MLEVSMLLLRKDILIKGKPALKYRILWVVYGLPSLISGIMTISGCQVPKLLAWTNLLALVLLFVVWVKDIRKWVRGEIKY